MQCDVFECGALQYGAFERDAAPLGAGKRDAARPVSDGGKLARLRALTGIALLTACGIAGATAYRCDDAGRVTYTNLPCPSGRQTELRETARAPSAEDRAAAVDRARADQSRLAAIERRREEERRQDQRAAALTARRGVDRGKQKDACPRLALRARRAHEDVETAGPRDQATKRVRARRADDDYAALCRRR